MGNKSLVAAAVAVGAIGTAGVAALAAPIYEQTYEVEAIVTPLRANGEPIAVSETWSTLVYRHPTKFYNVLRVFGEALHFEFEGEDYFALLRGASNSSAGAFDVLRECLDLKYLKDYETAPPLSAECSITDRTPMVVKVGSAGDIYLVDRLSSRDTYPSFDIEFVVRPSGGAPNYNLADQFPWIAKLPEGERTSLPPEIPEEGSFVPSKYYRKDFGVQK